VGGVERVDNALTVDSTAANDPPGELARSGASLEAVVAARLRGDPVLGGREIRVTASPGTNTVTMIGVVLSQSEKERAGRIAAEAFAAGHVRNELQVRSD
jgi:osmotically-inducible protein OsmY